MYVTLYLYSYVCCSLSLYLCLSLLSSIPMYVTLYLYSYVCHSLSLFLCMSLFISIPIINEWILCDKVKSKNRWCVLEFCLFNTEVNMNISRNLWTRFMDIYGYEHLCMSLFSSVRMFATFNLFTNLCQTQSVWIDKLLLYVLQS